MTFLHPQYNDILHEFPYNGKFYLIAYLALILAVFNYVYEKLKSKLNEYEMTLPYIVIWFVINILFYEKLPGAGFFVLPFIFVNLSLIISILFFKNTGLKV